MKTTIKTNNRDTVYKNLTVENDTGRIVFEADLNRKVMYVSSRSATFQLTKPELKKVVKFFKHITG